MEDCQWYMHFLWPMWGLVWSGNFRAKIREPLASTGVCDFKLHYWNMFSLWGSHHFKVCSYDLLCGIHWTLASGGRKLKEFCNSQCSSFFLQCDCSSISCVCFRCGSLCPSFLCHNHIFLFWGYVNNERFSHMSNLFLLLPLSLCERRHDWTMLKGETCSYRKVLAKKTNMSQFNS